MKLVKCPGNYSCYHLDCTHRTPHKERVGCNTSCRKTGLVCIEYIEKKD